MRRAQFERLVDQALEELPAWVLQRVDNLHVVVEDWPTRAQDPEGEGILGIYEGVSLRERGDWYSGMLPDRIVVFMGPHLELDLSPAELRREVRRTVLHEVGHYLGMSEAELEKAGYD